MGSLEEQEYEFPESLLGDSTMALPPERREVSLVAPSVHDVDSFEGWAASCLLLLLHWWLQGLTGWMLLHSGSFWTWLASCLFLAGAAGCRVVGSHISVFGANAPDAPCLRLPLTAAANS